MKNIDKTRPMSLEDDFPGFEEEFGLPNEPRQLTGVEFDRLLEFCASKGASDVTVQTEMPVYAYIEGRNLRITKRPLSASECDTLTNYMYGNNGTAKIRGGDEIDTRHMVTRRERNEAGSMVVKSRLGFRVNVTGCWSQGDENGLQITARTIKTLPPSLAERYVEPAIIEAMFPEQGLVLVCGPTGAGKTELLAGGIRAILEDPNSHKKVITYESPIEFVYDDIRRASAIISQHEIRP
jgi:defect-in-organelle-trafficking protein DotB